MTVHDLIASLTAERYDQRWWTGVHTTPPVDDEATCARRRREALADLTCRKEGAT